MKYYVKVTRTDIEVVKEKDVDIEEFRQHLQLVDKLTDIYIDDDAVDVVATVQEHRIILWDTILTRSQMRWLQKRHQNLEVVGYSDTTPARLTTILEAE